MPYSVLGTENAPDSDRTPEASQGTLCLGVLTGSVFGERILCRNSL